MDQEKLQELFEEKYARLLNMSFQDWLASAPKTEAEAYDELERLNTKIEQLSDAKDGANGDTREDISDQLEILRTHYALIEELFGLESQDGDW
jgi:phage shock protein A